MTVQWVLIASFVYFELGLITLLNLSYISPKLWHTLLHFHVWKSVAKKANVYFNVLIFVLILFFLDSIRDMRKYSTKSHHSEFDAELQNSVKLFRSQRNFYISGFAVFLWLVIRRLVVLILCGAELLTTNEEATIKAQEATENLEKLRKTSKGVQSSAKSDSYKNVLKLKQLEEEFGTKQLELENLKQEIAEVEERALHVQDQLSVLMKRRKELEVAE